MTFKNPIDQAWRAGEAVRKTIKKCIGIGAYVIPCKGRRENVPRGRLDIAAPVAVSHGGGSLLPVSRQHAPGVPSGDTHQRGCLIQCHVLSEQTVQNLKSGLFFWIQSHILHTVNMTFMLAS